MSKLFESFDKIKNYTQKDYMKLLLFSILFLPFLWAFSVYEGNWVSVIGYISTIVFIVFIGLIIMMLSVGTKKAGIIFLPLFIGLYFMESLFYRGLNYEKTWYSSISYYIILSIITLFGIYAYIYNFKKKVNG